MRPVTKAHVDYTTATKSICISMQLCIRLIRRYCISCNLITPLRDYNFINMIKKVSLKKLIIRVKLLGGREKKKYWRNDKLKKFNEIH